MVKSKKDYTELILCVCGCGLTRPKYDKWGYERPFIKGHQNRGRPLPVSETARMNMAEARRGWKNGMWKDNPKRQALHIWVRSHFWSTRLCQMCMQVPPYDLANITNIYNRDFKNWRYVCRRCHMRSDDRILNLKHQIKIVTNLPKT